MTRPMARPSLIAILVALTTAISGCVTIGRSWTLEPNGTGAASGRTIARHLASVPNDAAEGLARSLLGSYGIEIPSSVAEIEATYLDFETEGGMVVLDAVLLRFVVDQDDVAHMLNSENTGLLPQHLTLAQHPAYLRDMLGEMLDENTPADDITVHPSDPTVPPRNVAVVVPQSDPAEVRIIVYSIPNR